MSLTTQKTEKLLQGSQTFSNLSFSMLLMRMKMLYIKDPSTSVLQNCASEIGGFLDKFKATMSADYALIEKL